MLMEPAQTGRICTSLSPAGLQHGSEAYSTNGHGWTPETLTDLLRQLYAWHGASFKAVAHLADWHRPSPGPQDPIL